MSGSGKVTVTLLLSAGTQAPLLCSIYSQNRGKANVDAADEVRIILSERRRHWGRGLWLWNRSVSAVFVCDWDPGLGAPRAPGPGLGAEPAFPSIFCYEKRCVYGPSVFSAPAEDGTQTPTSVLTFEGVHQTHSRVLFEGNWTTFLTLLFINSVL